MRVLPFDLKAGLMRMNGKRALLRKMIVHFGDTFALALPTLTASYTGFVNGDSSDLKPGTKIFVAAAKKQADGTLQTSRITYGKDGLTPPM